jgi:Contractile injection system tube protein
MIQADGLALINLETGDSWVFQFFPERISYSDRTNWEPQDVTKGVKPLMYSNRDPQRITMTNVLLDSTDTGTSLTKEIEELRLLMSETDQGVPPILRLICGDSQQRVVLEELGVEKEMCDREGKPLRARLSLTFVEHKLIERVTGRIVEPDDGFNPIGNF